MTPQCNVFTANKVGFLIALSSFKNKEAHYFHLYLTYDTNVLFYLCQPPQEEQKEEAAIKTEPEVEEVKEEDAEKKKEEPAKQEKEAKGEEKVKEEAKKEKPSKEKKTEKKAEEAKSSKRQKTMQCKVTLLDDTQFECELDVSDFPNYSFLWL